MNSSDQDQPNPSDKSDATVAGDPPFVAKLVGTPAAANEFPGQSSNQSIDHTEAVRAGSPFRIDPPDLNSTDAEIGEVEAVYADYGPFLYTAMGASLSAALVLIFAAAGSLWFPAGGAIVAVLGTVLSIVGLFAARRFRWAALGCLPLHVGLFFLSYARSLS